MRCSPLFRNPRLPRVSIFKRSISDAIAAVVRYSLFSQTVHTWPALHPRAQVCQECKLDFSQHPLQHWHPTGTCSQPIISTLFTYTRVASNNELHCEVHQQHHSDRTHRWWGRRGLQDQGGQPGIMVWEQQPRPQHRQEEGDNGGHEKEGEPQAPLFSLNWKRGVIYSFFNIRGPHLDTWQ